MPKNKNDFDDQLVKVSPINSLFEAQLVDSILTEREIPHRLRSFHDTAYDGLFQVQKGWGEMYAPAEYKKEIKNIIDDIRSNTADETD
jgi:hypothetical protein